jgi:hypothetical protein
MKTIIIYAAILFSLNFQLNAAFGKSKSEVPFPAGITWQKSANGVWKGNSNMWYKIDKKNMSVKLSSNKRKWKPASNVIWVDNQGRYLFIYENKLMASTDGNKWLVVSDAAWQGIDGKWYRFDEEWNLMEAK